MKTKNKTILITAGPTREYIDPVRYISNGSSGKMGYSIADAAKKTGARVILISGPVSIKPPKNIKPVNVISAADMLKAAKKYFSNCDAFISCAAVSDYRPEKFTKSKIKKSGKPASLKLVPNPDILLTLSNSISRSAVRRPVLCGFALETENLIENALLKLKKKNLDIIVANGPESMESGTTSGALITKKGVRHFNRISKKRLARLLIGKILPLI